MEKDGEGGYVTLFGSSKLDSFLAFRYLFFPLEEGRGGEEERLLIFDPIIGFGGYFAFEDFISHLERRRG